MTAVEQSTTGAFRHAVVIGGGYAGMLAARVLSESFGRITIIERDDLAAGMVYRAGVPQARHPHAMLARGAQVLEELFPGLRAELAGLGAPIFDFGAATHVLWPTGWAPRADLGVTVQTFCRSTLESCIRARVLAHPAVTLVDNVQVEGLQFDAGACRVTAVTGTRRAAGQEAGEQLVVAADLVIDASGRSSRLPLWLDTLGLGKPDDATVQGNVAYATRLYQLPDNGDRDWYGAFVPTYAPTIRRGGLSVAIDGSRQLVALIGVGEDIPPTDPAGFKDFADTLPNRHIVDSIDHAVPLSRVYRYTNLNNRWTFYHKVRGWPDRLIAVGDSVCTFNPIYGQGMTVAALECVVLRDMIRRRAATGDLTGLSRRLQRSIARIVRVPWLMATSTDLGWQPGPPARATRIARWYMNNLFRVSHDDPTIYRRFARTQNMLDGPLTLAHPRVLLRVIRSQTGRSAPDRPPQ